MREPSEEEKREITGTHFVLLVIIVILFYLVVAQLFPEAATVK